MNEDKITSVAVKVSTKIRLKTYGSFGDTMDRILHRLMDTHDNTLKQSQKREGVTE